MQEKQNNIKVIDAETLMDKRLPPTKFCVDRPQGYDVMKTKSSFRTMPLLPFIEEELKKEKARQAELKRVMGRAYIDEYDDYVCTDALGRLYDPDYVTNHFKVILKRNKLRDIRFHELRHSCASLLLAKGIPMKMIQDWLGHSDMSTTVNVRNPHTN